MGMVFTQYLPDDSGGFLKGLIVAEPKLMHSIQHPAVYRLQSVTYIRKGPGDNDGHRIINVRGL